MQVALRLLGLVGTEVHCHQWDGGKTGQETDPQPNG